VEPTSGTVQLDGVEITSLGTTALRRARRRMGMIFQEYALVERLTVMENVLSGRLGYVGFWSSWFRRFPNADIEEAFRLLDRVGLAHMADKRADTLSGGQRQRIGIARALYKKSKVIIFDEATSALDNETESAISSAINSMRGSVTVIMVAHRLTSISQADTIYFIESGKISISGTFQELQRKIPGFGNGS
jgi:phosphonate transport system ATP-binding protein